MNIMYETTNFEYNRVLEQGGLKHIRANGVLFEGGSCN